MKPSFSSSLWSRQPSVIQMPSIPEAVAVVVLLALLLFTGVTSTRGDKGIDCGRDETWGGSPLLLVITGLGGRSNNDAEVGCLFLSCHQENNNKMV